MSIGSPVTDRGVHLWPDCIVFWQAWPMVEQGVPAHSWCLGNKDEAAKEV